MADSKFVYVEHDGIRGTLAYWAKHFQVPYSVFKVRYSRFGWDLDKLCAPVRAYNR